MGISTLYLEGVANYLFSACRVTCFNFQHSGCFKNFNMQGDSCTTSSEDEYLAAGPVLRTAGPN